MTTISLHHQKIGIFDRTLFLFWMISAAVLVFSFYHEYMEKVAPCALCQAQRFLYLLIFALSPIGFTSRLHLFILRALIGLFLIGFCLATYHSLIQQGYLPDRCSMTQKIENMNDFLQMLEQSKPSCANIGWKLFGLSASIYNAFFSLLGFIALSLKTICRIGAV